MRYERAEPPLDARIAALAARQHGVVTRAQLGALGLDHSAIARRMRAGRLHQLRRNVYAVGHTRLTIEGHYLSAVLSYGNQAVLSHDSAAVLWKLRPVSGPRVDVTVPGGGTRARRGAVIVHRSPLPKEHIMVRGGIPITTPARTVVDLADCSTRRELARLIDEAHFLGWNLPSLQPLPGRRGAGLLAAVLAEHTPGSTRTRSELEERFLALCHRYDLPHPLVNHVVEGHECDFVWPDARVIVETDGWAAHGRQTTRERDLVRDAELEAAGWHVIRVTWRRLTQEPEALAAQLARLLALRMSP
jgi:hypothetical protein